MYQRASQGGISPSVTSKSLSVGSSVSFDAPQNGVYWFERAGSGLEYQNYACGYFINGVHTNSVTRSPATVSVSGGSLTITMGSGGQAGTAYLYKAN